MILTIKKVSRREKNTSGSQNKFPEEQKTLLEIKYKLLLA